MQKIDSGVSHISKYYHWYQSQRDDLFSIISYNKSIYYNGLPVKSGNILNNQIISKVMEFGNITKIYGDYAGSWFHDGPTYWIRALPFEPKGNASDKSSHYHSVKSISKEHSSILTAVLASNIFYIYFKSISNCRDFNSSLIDSFKIPVMKSSILVQLIENYSSVLKNTAEKKSRKYESGFVEYDEYYPAKAKTIIDEIDKVLAKHYGFAEEELDFIINYDIKYRMGDELEDEGEE